MEIFKLQKKCNKKARKVSQPKKSSGSDEPKKVSGSIEDPSEEDHYKGREKSYQDPIA